MITRIQTLALAACALPLLAQGPVEPQAGNWKTWVITSGKDFRVPPPPDAAATRPNSRSFGVSLPKTIRRL